MESNPSPYDNIEQYLLGNLPRDEQLAMERAIAEQPELAREVELQRLEFDAAQELIAQDIRVLFKRLGEQEQKPPATPGARQWWYYLAAAAVLAPLAIWLYQFLNAAPGPNPDTGPSAAAQDSTLPIRNLAKNGIDSTKVITPDTTPPVRPPGTPDQKKDETTRKRVAGKSDKQTPGPASPLSAQQQLAVNLFEKTRWNTPPAAARNGGPGVQNPLSDALTAYQKKEFSTAVRQLETIPVNDGKYRSAQLLLARCYFHLKRYNTCAQAAETVITVQTPDSYTEEAQWLWLLAQVAGGQTQSRMFQEQFNALLKDSGHTFFKEVKALNTALDNLHNSSGG